MSRHEPVRFSQGTVLILLLGLAGSLFGCGSGETGSGASEWTIDEGALTLERDLLAGDDEEYFFSQIRDVAVRGDGRMYVAEGEAGLVRVFNPDGTLRDTLGRKGGGPGEFREVSEVVVARSDSVYVLDGHDGRLSVFAPNGDYVYSLARDKTKGPNDMMVPEGMPGFVFVYSPMSRRVVKNDAPYTVRLAGASGEVGDTLFTARPDQIAMKDLDRGMLFTSIPFARGSYFAFGPDARIHYAWNDSLRVTTYDLSGQETRTVDIPFEAVPVTEEDIERVLKDRSRTRDLVRDRIPSTKPAFDEFLVDDKGRYWFGRYTSHPDTTEWWVAWPDEKRVATTRLSDDVNFITVQNGYVYGETTTEDGAPALVRYRIRVSSNQ